MRGAVLISPIAGTVIRVRGRVGEHCRQGEPAVFIADDARGRWLEGYVSERDAERVRVGQHAFAEIVVGSGVTIKAVVDAVGLATNRMAGGSTTASSESATAGEEVWVKLRLNNPSPEMLPGLTARVVIHVR